MDLSSFQVLLFWILSILVLATAILLLFIRELDKGILLFLVNSGGVGGILLTLGIAYPGMVQIGLATSGILVFFSFDFLYNKPLWTFSKIRQDQEKLMPAMVGGGVVLGGLVWMAWGVNWSQKEGVLPLSSTSPGEYELRLAAAFLAMAVAALSAVYFLREESNPPREQ